jgi:hypothetical protein
MASKSYEIWSGCDYERRRRAYELGIRIAKDELARRAALRAAALVREMDRANSPTWDEIGALQNRAEKAEALHVGLRKHYETAEAERDAALAEVATLRTYIASLNNTVRH